MKDKYEKCLNLEKYSYTQSMCIKTLVLEHMRKKEVKSKFMDRIQVLSKSPLYMEHPNEVAHLNFDELVMGFYPDNIHSGSELKEAIKHEVAHLISNDKAMPTFHDDLEKKTIQPILVDKFRPGHNESWQKEI